MQELSRKTASAPPNPFAMLGQYTPKSKKSVKAYELNGRFLRMVLPVSTANLSSYITMKTPRKIIRLLLAVAVSMSLASVAVEAFQGSIKASGPSGALLFAMAANAKLVMQYAWKQRVTVFRKGKAAPPVIDQVRFDANGHMQRTTLSAPPEMGGIRGKIAAGVKENVRQIMAIVASYNKPQQMVETVKTAKLSQESGGATRLDAANVLKSGDNLTMLVNPATHLAKHIDIKTDYDGGPLAIAQDYGPVNGSGPNMMQSMKVSAPQKDLVINVESYDFTQAK
jgi:hypothetical protein